MKTFWDERYKSKEYVYGEAPNAFFTSKIGSLEPGKLILPAEGEGRNAVFAAKLGWDVSAFDWSEEGRKKAEKLADKEQVKIEYLVSDLEHVRYKKESFDLLGLFFAHFPEKVRHAYHRKLASYVKPGGKLILEGFAKAHIELSRANPKAGGPREEGMLFSREIIREDFPEFQWELLEEVTAFLEEGAFHAGKSVLVRAVGTKVD
ncbi:class I SAM-dependent methyltransferase [Cyclobacterium jeungdonense]|uniref:Class I SAM-dependent methyltransferase n=1 Tax=Cyclobacterium jeungdonense TaxID=708087 RepID=A0ABT8C3T6_9BACT|nr:class I SAM-dependent methyltransferase [Cyclobacterium jeungdonense]MDN3686433.1 class I SAM-dependent methyltransferase [Cyclobacterium jeungdonense]